MDVEARSRFKNYLFSNALPYCPLMQAINDKVCLELAKEIINREELFIKSNKNPTIKEKVEHFKSMREFLIVELGGNTQLVKDLDNQIEECYNDGKREVTKRSYWDDINRIRAVFDLWHEE